MIDIIFVQQHTDVTYDESDLTVLACTHSQTLGSKLHISYNDIFPLERKLFASFNEFLAYFKAEKELLVKCNFGADRLVNEAVRETTTGNWCVSLEEFAEKNDLPFAYVRKHEKDILFLILKNPAVLDCTLEDESFYTDLDCDEVCRHCGSYCHRNRSTVCHNCEVWSCGMEDVFCSNSDSVAVALKVAEEQLGKEKTDIGFRFDGQWISNPFMDCTGRFELSLEDAYLLYGIENVNSFIRQCVEQYPRQDEFHIIGIAQKQKDDYSYWQLELSKEDETAIYKILDKYSTSGCSVSGTKSDVLQELSDDMLSKDIFDGCEGTKDMLDSAVTALLLRLQEQNHITSGDISPVDALTLDELETALFRHIDKILAAQKR